ncbi:type III pantothenate kinase [Mesonia maritima]|uniref:Type III pantothenate kinase n=1 Tax=Mesonia maritima TaxID=1793873 RepID=A0ABU1K1L5_9FLAO|nr:type III pantothenate kinase [Mesonia maritima]MDR6299499.1 type III pantothenate kinase [Mesonia maritima]
MNLVIDIGNTFIKLAVFQKDEIVSRAVFEDEKLMEKIQEILKTHKIEHGIISSVKTIPADELAFLRKNINLIILDHTLSFPFLNLYETPETLGKDRLALAAAAVKLFPNKNILIIDAGTCITYDFLENNKYHGGAISPGIEMRFKAMHNFTAKLPLIKTTDENETELTGKTTRQNMKIGVLKGVPLEIDGFIDLYKQDYKDLTVILTGGDSELLSKSLKNSIFAPENFLLKGLNTILEFNKI